MFHMLYDQKSFSNFFKKTNKMAGRITNKFFNTLLIYE